MNKKVLLCSAIVCSLAMQANAYIPADLEKFKNENDCSHCNLTQIDVYHTYDYKEKKDADYSNSYFTKAKLDGFIIKDSTFDNANFVGSSLNRIEFNNSSFDNTNFTSSRLSYIKFIKSTFSNANLSYIHVSGSFSSCTFKNVTFDKADLANTAFSKATITDSSFESALLKKADLSRVHVENVKFDNADLTEAILIGSNITEEMLANAKSYRCAILANGDVYTNNGEYSCK